MTDAIAPDYFTDELYAKIINGLGSPRFQKSGWSVNVSCPFHDDKTPSAGWNKDSHILRCFTCGKSYTTKEVAERLNIPWQEYTIKPQPSSKPATPPPPNGTPPPAPAAITHTTSVDGLARLKARLEGKRISLTPPLIMPYSILWPYGVKVLQAGKMTGILGLTGGGKTSFIECLTDMLRKGQGVNIGWWGPEWTAEQMQERAVQRGGGLTIPQIDLHEMWLSEEARIAKGETITRRLGEKADPALLAKSLAVIDDVASWPGQAFYIDKMGLPLELVLQKAQDIIDEQRDKNPIRVWVFDYAQLWDTLGGGTELERINYGINKIKAFTSDNQLHTIIAAQPTKNASSMAKNGTDKRKLTLEDAHSMRGWQFNLFLAIEPIWIKDMASGKDKLSDRGIIRVEKNSSGPYPREVGTKIDFKQLSWLDERAGV